jgi:hypothetical protein
MRGSCGGNSQPRVGVGRSWSEFEIMNSDRRKCHSRRHFLKIGRRSELNFFPMGSRINEGCIEEYLQLYTPPYTPRVEIKLRPPTTVQETPAAVAFSSVGVRNFELRPTPTELRPIPTPCGSSARQHVKEVSR